MLKFKVQIHTLADRKNISVSSVAIDEEYMVRNMMDVLSCDLIEVCPEVPYTVLNHGENVTRRLHGKYNEGVYMGV